MKIENNQLNDSALSNFGMEVVGLLLSGNYAELAQRFGYAMSYGRKPEEAIKEDFTNCCPLDTSQPFSHKEIAPTIAVKYFKPNDSKLLAVVECTVQVGNSEVLIELVATGSSEGIYLTLEDMNVEA